MNSSTNASKHAQPLIGSPPWSRGPSEEICNATRIVEVLEHHALQQPDRVIYSYVGKHGEVDEELTYGQLFEDASRVATRILSHVDPGTPVMLLFASSLDFIKAFMGCQIAGVIPVPVMPPRQATAAEANRVTSILLDAGATVVITSSEILSMAKAFLGAYPALSATSWISVDELDDLALSPICEAEEAGPLALLQYTSGSTSRPRGVMVGHDNLMCNLGDIYWAEQNHEETISVSWLPMSHDMGLIEGVLQPLYANHRAYLMSPVHFMKRPLSWLEIVSKVRANVSGGPNFAYDLVLRDLANSALPPYDFSQWQFAYNGSEPVSADTMERFAHRMAPCGFQPRAFAPLYGLAEATLGVTEGRRGKRLRHQTRVGVGGERVVVSCGTTLDHTQIAIVDAQTKRRVFDGEEGEIWLRGPGVTRGYWQRPEQTKEVFEAKIQGEEATSWLQTGDLGFMLDKELFVSGRSKEVIVCRGQNIYPQDLEVTAYQAHPLVRQGGVVAFRVSRETDEAAILVAEVNRHAMREGVSPEQLEAAAHVVRSHVASTHGVAVDAVVMVRAGTIPRTTSGKRQRLKVRKMHESGKLEPVALAARATGSRDEEAKTESWLLSHVAATLGVQPLALDLEKTLPELGLDSLRAMELLIELDGIPQYANLHLIQMLTLSVSDLIAHINNPAEAHQTSSWRQDAQLEEEITPNLEASPKGTSVLLTGATGFLGSHVAIELLAQGDTTIQCLVRGEGAKKRLLATLSEHPDWQHSWAERIHVLRGSLELPRFGLTPEQLAEVTTNTRAIYHCAAMVNWAYPYAALRQANVEGTRGLIRLACHANASLTYLSTLASCWSHGHQSLVDETSDPTDHIEGIHLDYVRSKAVAESLVRQAASRGLEVSIIRPGLVFSHAHTKAHRPGDFLSALCKGCIEMGAAPDLNWDMEVCTVDEVARWTVNLEPTAGEAVPALHIGSHERRLWRGMVLWLNLRGYPIELMPYEAWCEALKVDVQRPSAPLRPLFDFFLRPINACQKLRLPQLYESHRKNPISNAHSNALLNQEPRASFNAAHLQATFDRLIRMGYLPTAASHTQLHVQDETLWRQELEALVHESLCTKHPGSTIKALRIEGLTPSEQQKASHHGIVSELASWRFGTTTGIHHLTIHYDLGGHTKTMPAVLKAQVKDLHAIEVGQDVASLCGKSLGEAWRTHQEHHEMWKSDAREAALYQMDAPQLRAHTPALYGACQGMLLLEDISDFPMLHDISSWQPQHLESALSGLAKIHAIAYNEPHPVGQRAWWAPQRTGKALIAQMPLLRAMLEFALSRPMGRWLKDTGVARVRTLLDTLPSWAHTLESHPHALIHNDCNPRNLAFRPDGSLCAFDWELARHGLPQRDLCELLCFTLEEDVSAQTLDAWINMHREHLEAHTGDSIDPTTWRQGFSLSLADLMLSRLTMYAMLDYVHPQSFLQRIITTWVRLDALTSGDAT